MRHICNVIASSAALLAVGASLDRAGAHGVIPRPPDYEPVPPAYGAPHGHKPHPAYSPPYARPSLQSHTHKADTLIYISREGHIGVL